ncbi:hypothetical protein RQP46_005359 [Phenoliferia psychrophenolica]
MLTSLVATVLAASLAAAVPLSPRDAAIRNSPSYAPREVVCPVGLNVRQTTATGPLNPAEAAYIAARTAQSKMLWSTYLAGAGLTNFELKKFIPKGTPVAGSTLPNIAVSVSGGGFRAMLTGGGILSGLDSRVATAVEAGTGGLLQLANYAVGLSGGGWCLGSWAAANYPTFEDMLAVWDFQDEALLPKPSDPTVYQDAALSTITKFEAGFPVSDDMDNPNGPGSETLVSSIQKVPNYVSHSAPFPIFYATGREPSTTNVSMLSPRYEVTPVAFGLNHPSVGSVDIPIEYLGTKMFAGHPTSTCVEGMENAGWLLGANGNSITNPGLYVDLVTASSITPEQGQTISSILSLVPDAYADSATLANPFMGISPLSYRATDDQLLFLLDGGASEPNITNLPIWPMIQPSRKIDVIFAIDDSGDTADAYPSGVALYIWSLVTKYAGFGVYPYPAIPTPDRFLSEGRTKRISFLGSSCEPDHLTSSATITPLIIYIPKYHVNYNTNTSSSTTQYSVEEQQGFYANGMAIATGGQNKECFACAVIDAQQTRNKVARTAQCEACFADYCFNA